MAYKVDHVHLLAADPEATARFYEEMFGARRVGQRLMGDGRVFITLDLGGLAVLVSPPRAAAPADGAVSGCGHYGLQHFGLVTEDLDKAVATLKGKGATFTEAVSQPQPGLRITFLRGPDNVVIELLEKKPG